MNNNQRRSGRTVLIIAKAIAELLETGSTKLQDHPHGNHSHTFYLCYLEEPFRRALRILINNSAIIDDLFEFKYIYRENYVDYIAIRANNIKGEFQY